MTSLKPKPIYLLAGGRRGSRTEGDPILETVVKKIGKPAPSVAYVGAANGDSPDFFKWMTSYLQMAGAGEVRLAPMAGKGADLEEARHVLNTADSVFISGGDVEAGMRQLEEKNLNSVFGSLYRRGVLFFGSSAGSIMLAKCWIRWRDPADDLTAEIFPCMGLADVVCDTHGEAEGWEELHCFLKLTGTDRVGYGIPTGLALCIHPDGSVEAIGGAVNRFVWREGKIHPLPDLLPSPL